MTDRKQSSWYQEHRVALTQALLFFGLASVAAGILCFLVHQDHDAEKALIEAYVALRGSIFTGFFTIGGFLLTLKNLILTSVRQGVYDKKEYQQRHLRSDRKDQSLYVSLRKLGALIHFSIVGSFLTSFVQLTFGLHKASWTAILALSLAAGTAGLLGSCLFHLRLNLLAWFDQLDREWIATKKKLEAEAAAEAETASSKPRGEGKTSPDRSAS